MIIGMFRINVKERPFISASVLNIIVFDGIDKKN